MQEVDPIESEPEPVEGYPDPCPEDEEYFVRPDAGDMEEAIDKFWMGWTARSAVASRKCTASWQHSPFQQRKAEA